MPKSPAQANDNSQEAAFKQFFDASLLAQLKSAYTHKGVEHIKTFEQLETFLTKGIKDIYSHTERFKQMSEFLEKLSEKLDKFRNNIVTEDKPRLKNIENIDIAINSAANNGDNYRVKDLQYLKAVPDILEQSGKLSEISKKLAENLSKMEASNQHTVQHVTRPSQSKAGSEAAPDLKPDSSRKPTR